MKRKRIPLLVVCALLVGALVWLFVFPADITLTRFRLLPDEPERAGGAAYYLNRIRNGGTNDANFLYVNEGLSWDTLRPEDLTVATVSLTAKNHLPFFLRLNELSIPENALIAFIPVSEKQHGVSAFSEKTRGYTLYFLLAGDAETLSAALGGLSITAHFTIGPLLNGRAPVRLLTDKNE